MGVPAEDASHAGHWRILLRCINGTWRRVAYRKLFYKYHNRTKITKQAILDLLCEQRQAIQRP